MINSDEERIQIQDLFQKNQKLELENMKLKNCLEKSENCQKQRKVI